MYMTVHYSHSHTHIYIYIYLYIQKIDKNTVIL